MIFKGFMTIDTWENITERAFFFYFYNMSMAFVTLHGNRCKRFTSNMGNDNRDKSRTIDIVIFDHYFFFLEIKPGEGM